MDQHLFGKVTSKLKYFYLLIFFIISSSCDKEDCYTIDEKKEINGNYYFYFDSRENQLPRGNQSTTQGSGYPDRFASGQVNKETYDSVNVGDKYCN
tara:strand:+ start:1452 stop:1739 length:288 start_codon:yes stop_codon:yes gene_type:complete